jgi:hypothetical protein
MAETNTKPKKDRTLWYVAAGGVGLFVLGRYLGRREADEDLDLLLAECSNTNRVDTQLADTAAHASELSHQLYEISRRLREGSA